LQVAKGLWSPPGVLRVLPPFPEEVSHPAALQLLLHPHHPPEHSDKAGAGRDSIINPLWQVDQGGPPFRQRFRSSALATAFARPISQLTLPLG
jgi:hypothetical protein